MLKIRLLSVFVITFFSSLPLIAGFSDITKRAAIAACKPPAYAGLLAQPWLNLFGDMDGLRNRIDGACASQENIRGVDGKAAYSNQDCLAFGFLKGNIFCGIFDGHGAKGNLVAAFLKNEVVRRVLLSKKPGQSLKEALADMQNMLKKNKDAQHAGATAVISVLDDTNLLTVANVGDSRLLVVRNGKELFSTRDHKPSDPAEAARVVKNGGYVADGRVWDPKTGIGFALARSMGDISSQGTALIAEPDITSVQLTKGDTIVLASDGVWDVLSNEQVIALVAQGGMHQEIADRIVEKARAQGSADDITTVVFTIK